MPPFSVGIDLVDVSRIARLIPRSAFLRRVFTPLEIAYCQKTAHPAQHFAARFAVKEAVIKALGHREIPLVSIGVFHAKSGQPKVILSGPWTRFNGRLQVSLTHTATQAAAVVLLSPR